MLPQNLAARHSGSVGHGIMGRQLGIKSVRKMGGIDIIDRAVPANHITAILLCSGAFGSSSAFIPMLR